MNEFIMFFVYLVLHPLWYVGLFIIYLLSARRIKRERESFHTRVYAQISDWTIPLLPALIAGLALSLVIGGIGVVFPKEFLYVLIIITVLFALTFQLRWMTPLYSLGLLLLLYSFAPLFEGVALLTPLYDILSLVPMEVIASLLVLFTLTEAILIRTNAVKYTSPRLERSKRGKWIGVHASNRLWMIPVLLFIPDGFLPSTGYWPLFTIGEGSWQPVVFPFLLGFRQVISSELPKQALKRTSNYVLLLSVVLALLAVGTFYYSIFIGIIGAVALIGREAISFFMKRRDESKTSHFTSKPEGCIVLGVLPESPAEKMEITVGETIMKVNGQAVNNEESFYRALQQNAAFCKLEILNIDGQVRLAQGALYDDQHHQLGVLLVKEDVQLQDSVV